jgi:HlyD family secretion protein
MMKRAITLLLLLAAGAALAWAFWPRPLLVEMTAVDKRDLVVTVSDEGKTRVREIYSVSAPITGHLLRVNLHAGDDVIAGTTVVASMRPVAPALLDARSRRMAEVAVDAALAAVELATTQVKQAEAQRGFLVSELERARTLVRRGAIAERTYQKAQLDEQVAAAELGRAKANLAVQQQQLESARAALIETDTGAGSAACCIEVRAPLSGKILRVVTESEQVIQAGTPLLEIGDPGDIEVSVDLLSRDAVRVPVGADATIDGWGGPPLAARVRRIDPAASTKVSALGIEEQRVNVVLDLVGPQEDGAKLGHGFRVVVHIAVWKGEGLLSVPVGALFRDGADWAVFVGDGGRARLRKVSLGQRNDEFAVVKDGLRQGEQVILHPGDAVADGVKVEPAPAP